MKDTHKMSKREIIDSIVSEFVHFYWVRRINMQILLWVKNQEIEKRKKKDKEN